MAGPVFRAPNMALVQEGEDEDSDDDMDVLATAYTGDPKVFEKW